MPGAENSGTEYAILGVAAVAGGVVASVWAGASAAALVSGHGPLGVGLVAAAHAIPGLLSHPGLPAAAWRPPAAAHIPGPVLYWVCTIPVLIGSIAAVAVVGSLIARRRSVGLERRKRMGLNPEARFARAADLVPLWVKGPSRNRVVLGRVEGQLVATEDSRLDISDQVPWHLRRRASRRRGARGAVAVMGPSQCGKTMAFAVPAILEWQGPVIALSVKSDLLGATIEARRKRGEVKVFDPGDATCEPTSSWSPLRSSMTLSGAKKAARALANATDWSASSGDMKFWVTGAVNLLAALLFVAAQNEMSMDHVVTWALTMDRPDDNQNEGDGGSMVANLAGKLCNRNDPVVANGARKAAELLQGIWKLDFKQVSSVYVTAMFMISCWQEPTVSDSAKGEAIDLAWLLGDADKPPGRPPQRRNRWRRSDEPAVPAKANTLYLCALLDEPERLAPVLAGLVGDLMTQCYERVGKSNQPIGPILLVIDEAGNWPLQNLPGLASTCAGIGIQLVVIYQSKAQIDSGYGPRADIVISNCLTKIFFAGLSDRSSLDYAEGLLGYEQVLSRQDSVDVSGGNGRRSVSQSTTRTELMPRDLLRQVRPGEALLIHNTLPPGHLICRYWFKDPALHLLATGTALPNRVDQFKARRRPLGADSDLDEVEEAVG